MADIQIKYQNLPDLNWPLIFRVMGISRSFFKNPKTGRRWWWDFLRCPATLNFLSSHNPFGDAIVLNNFVSQVGIILLLSQRKTRAKLFTSHYCAAGMLGKFNSDFKQL